LNMLFDRLVTWLARCWPGDSSR
jgi:PD-(D/E)XK endonuclease